MAPRHLSFEEAATLPVSSVTAWQSLFVNGSVKPGDNVLVQGTGGVSIAAIQLARSAGARIISVVRNEKHREALQCLGASDVLLSGNPNWHRQVFELTSGIGANVIVNVAGGETVSKSLLAASGAATIHLVGYASGKIITFDIFEAIRRAAKFLVAAAGSRASFEALVRVLELEEIHPLVAQRFPVQNHGEAMDSLRRGGHIGKLVLTFG